MLNAPWVWHRYCENHESLPLMIHHAMQSLPHEKATRSSESLAVAAILRSWTSRAKPPPPSSSETDHDRPATRFGGFVAEIEKRSGRRSLGGGRKPRNQAPRINKVKTGVTVVPKRAWPARGRATWFLEAQ
jgi:hypothetical protein